MYAKFADGFMMRFLGDPDNGIAPGTKWEDLPDDFKSPLCGVRKDDFEIMED